jgi:hypothetical protein
MCLLTILVLLTLSSGIYLNMLIFDLAFLSYLYSRNHGCNSGAQQKYHAVLLIPIASVQLSRCISRVTL